MSASAIATVRSELYIESRMSTAVDTLDLTPHVNLPAQEVDVADLHGRGSPRRRPAKAARPT